MCNAQCRAKLVGTAKEMFTGAPLPATVNSMNAYYGAGPIVRALEAGAEIVVTGRATDRLGLHAAILTDWTAVRWRWAP